MYGQSDSTSGIGVLGHATATTGTYTFGVFGQSDSISGIGVLAYAGNNGATPIVAQANSSSQSANLQEWRGGSLLSPSVLSVVDANG